MRVFDNYYNELPALDAIDWEETKKNIGNYLAAYRTSRERVHLSTTPKISAEGQLALLELRLLEGYGIHNRNKKYQQIFQANHRCFIHGFSAIVEPFQPDRTQRRRKIFFYRYILGLTIEAVCGRIYYQRNVVMGESKLAIRQFASATGLLVMK